MLTHAVLIHQWVAAATPGVAYPHGGKLKLQCEPQGHLDKSWSLDFNCQPLNNQFTVHSTK